MLASSEMLAEEIIDVVSSSKDTKRNFLMAEAADDGVRQAIESCDVAGDPDAQGAGDTEDHSTSTSDSVGAAILESSALQRRPSYAVAIFDKDMTDDMYRQIGIRDTEAKKTVMESMSDDTWIHIAKHLRVQKLVTKIALAVIDASTGFLRRLADNMGDIDGGSDLPSQSTTPLTKQSSGVSESRQQSTAESERFVSTDPPGRSGHGDGPLEPVTVHESVSTVSSLTGGAVELPNASIRETGHTSRASRWTRPYRNLYPAASTEESISPEPQTKPAKAKPKSKLDTVLDSRRFLQFAVTPAVFHGM